MDIGRAIVMAESIEEKIFLIRDCRVMLDAELAALYGVSTKQLNQQVKRNRERFPRDFMFRLNEKEWGELVTNCDRLGRLKHSSVLPHVFTEHGAIMLASVLNSQRAIEVSVLVVRAFVKFREMLSTHKELAHKFKELERQLVIHDKAIRSLFDTIRQMMAQPEPKSRKIGFDLGKKSG